MKGNLNRRQQRKQRRLTITEKVACCWARRVCRKFATVQNKIFGPLCRKHNAQLNEELGGTAS